LSGELDEYRIADLVAAEAPVDAFGVGTHLVAGAGCPAPGFIYKLVAIADRPGDDAPLRPVAKAGGVKSTVGGRKQAWRRLDRAGLASAELVVVGPGDGGRDDGPGKERLRSLQMPYITDGSAVWCGSVSDARSHCRTVLAELPPRAFDLTPGDPCLPTILTHDEHL
jgi:nicotinate phosphoribosyltransferase